MRRAIAHLGLVNCLTMMVLSACLSMDEGPMLVTPISPRLLPEFLHEVHPKQGAILSLDDYAGTVCILLDACPLLHRGDFWEFDDVYERTTISVDGRSKGIAVVDGSRYSDYLMGCIEGFPETPTAIAGGPYEWCVGAPLAAGIHQVDVHFEQSNGEVASFAWTFRLVDGPVPTATPPLTPAEVDRAGILPAHVEAVYPSPGERVSPPENWEDWPTLLESRGMPAVRLTGVNVQPICVALVRTALSELGTFPMDRHIYDRFFLTVDGNIQRDWLFPRFDTGGVQAQCIEAPMSPGEHITTLYVEPFDADLVVYSWAFTLEGR